MGLVQCTFRSRWIQQRQCSREKEIWLTCYRTLSKEIRWKRSSGWCNGLLFNPLPKKKKRTKQQQHKKHSRKKQQTKYYYSLMWHCIEKMIRAMLLFLWIIFWKGRKNKSSFLFGWINMKQTYHGTHISNPFCLLLLLLFFFFADLCVNIQYVRLCCGVNIQMSLCQMNRANFSTAQKKTYTQPGRTAVRCRLMSICSFLVAGVTVTTHTHTL